MDGAWKAIKRAARASGLKKYAALQEPAKGGIK